MSFIVVINLRSTGIGSTFVEILKVLASNPAHIAFLLGWLGSRI